MRAKHADGVVLRAIAHFKGMGKVTTDGSTSPDYLPKIIMDFKLHEGLSKKEITSAMRGLMVAGRLQKGIVGTYASSRHDRLGLIDKEAKQ